MAHLGVVAVDLHARAREVLETDARLPTAPNQVRDVGVGEGNTLRRDG